jgi:hypothetical protein
MLGYNSLPFTGKNRLKCVVFCAKVGEMLATYAETKAINIADQNS